MSPLRPILSCADARDFEAARFAGDDEAALAAMRAAGAGVATAALTAFREAGDRGRNAWILFGKGANGADALFAARHLAAAGLRCLLVPAFDRKHWIHAVRTAHDELLREHPETVPHAHLAGAASDPRRPLVIDGLTGSGFRPPLAPHLHALIAALNATRAMVVAVDLPSGAGDVPDALTVRADVTVATGILKRPLLADERVRRSAGRIRFTDIGLLDEAAVSPCGEYIVSDAVFRPLRAPLPADADKRARGHTAIFGGSPEMPGALLMNTLAALRAGAGLVTAHAPASVQPAFAAAAPEAMWVPVPETDGVTSWTSALRRFLKNTPRIGAAVCGSGMGENRPVAELARTLIRDYPGALVLDADALRPAILNALPGRPKDFGPVVLTPHAGEFHRIAGADVSLDALRAFADATGAIVALKGPATRIAEPGRVALVPCGGPALARGGSGDLLAGILGAMLARESANAFETVCRAVAWHGLAADHLAAERGALTLRTTELLDALGPCLRERAP